MGEKTNYMDWVDTYSSVSLDGKSQSTCSKPSFKLNTDYNATSSSTSDEWYFIDSDLYRASKEV